MGQPRKKVVIAWWVIVLVAYTLLAAFLAILAWNVSSFIVFNMTGDEQNASRIAIRVSAGVILLEIAILIFVIIGINRASQASEDLEVR